MAHSVKISVTKSSMQCTQNKILDACHAPYSAYFFAMSEWRQKQTCIAPYSAYNDASFRCEYGDKTSFTILTWASLLATFVCKPISYQCKILKYVFTQCSFMYFGDECPWTLQRVYLQDWAAQWTSKRQMWVRKAEEGGEGGTDGRQSCKMSQIWQIYLCRNIGKLG